MNKGHGWLGESVSNRGTDMVELVVLGGLRWMNEWMNTLLNKYIKTKYVNIFIS